MLWIHTKIIQGSRDQLAFDQSPGLIAVFHALHRLLAPRHPPHALSSLAALIFPLAVTPKNRLRSSWGLTRSRTIHRYVPVRAFGQDCVTNSLSFVLSTHTENTFQQDTTVPPRIACAHLGAWLSLVKIQLIPLPNCQRTTWQNPRGIYDNQKEQQSFQEIATNRADQERKHVGYAPARNQVRFVRPLLSGFYSSAFVSSIFRLFIGDEGDRTLNLRLAKPALSQLSYVPGMHSPGADTAPARRTGCTWTRTMDLSLIRAAL